MSARHQAVDWSDFLSDFVLAVEMILIGVLFRRSGRLARTALGMIAFGLALCFLICFGILTLTILPFANPMIDQHLHAADAALGFVWVDAVIHLADYSNFSAILRFVYLSMFPQLVFVVVLLAYLKREVDLHRFLLVYFLSMTLASAVWWFFPSIGPAAYGTVSAQVHEKISLVANSDYGEKMWRYATEGAGIVARSKMAGVIAFPSMRIAMSSMVLWFSRRTWAFVPMVALNVLMPVATVLHGGHRVVDLFGGYAVLGLCLWLGIRLFPDRRHTADFGARQSG